MKNMFVLPGAAAFAAAALSLCLGGGVAHAQEATDNSVTSVHVQAPRIVDTVRVTNDSPTPKHLLTVLSHFSLNPLISLDATFSPKRSTCPAAPLSVLSMHVETWKPRKNLSSTTI